MESSVLAGKEPRLDVAIEAALMPVVQNTRLGLAKRQRRKKFDGSFFLLDVRQQVLPPGPMRKRGRKFDRLGRVQFILQQKWIRQPEDESRAA